MTSLSMTWSASVKLPLFAISFRAFLSVPSAIALRMLMSLSGGRVTLSSAWASSRRPGGSTRVLNPLPKPLTVS